MTHHSKQLACAKSPANGQGLPVPPIVAPGSAAPDAEVPAGRESHEASILQALRRCWMPACFFGLLAAVLAASVTWFAWPAPYATAALLHIPPRPGTYGEDLQQHARTQLALLRSRGVIEQALQRPEVANLSLLRGVPDPIALIEKHVQVDANRGPEILVIGMSGDQPAELPVIVNAMVAIFVEESQRREATTHQAKLKQLQKQKADYERLLREKRATLQALEERYGAQAVQTTAQRREQEILELIWAGFKNKEIGQRLKISVKTVEAHRANMMKKMRVSNTAQLLKTAIQGGILKIR